MSYDSAGLHNQKRTKQHLRWIFHDFFNKLQFPILHAIPSNLFALSFTTKNISNCVQHYSRDQKGITYFLQWSYHTNIKTRNLEEFPPGVKKTLHAKSAYSANVQRRKHVPMHTVKRVVEWMSCSKHS